MVIAGTLHTNCTIINNNFAAILLALMCVGGFYEQPKGQRVCVVGLYHVWLVYTSMTLILHQVFTYSCSKRSASTMKVIEIGNREGLGMRLATSHRLVLQAQ